MSAKVNTFCKVENLEDIKTSLAPEEKTKQEVYRDDDWDNRWNWDTSELAIEDEDSTALSKSHLWLNDCIIAISPFTDTLVIGRGQTLSIFHLNSNGKDRSQDPSSSFNLVYTTTLPGLERDEALTSLVLLPFVSHQKSAVNFRDWTAIIGGFSTGYFRIFAENGKPLLSHLFHDEPILDIKCRTYSMNHLLTTIEQTDEILIIYPTAVIQIDGFTLQQTLRLCRNRLSKEYDSSFGGGYFSKDPNSGQTPFTFKKWTFEISNDGQVYDCINVCSFVKNDFDALVSHSISGKPLSNDFANLFFTTGTNPYVGFYRAQEGKTHAIIDELSQLLVNRLKNVFSYFNQPKQQEENPKEQIKPSTIVPSDLSLYDERLGLKICLSPNRRLAAVTDDFGRVILFDMQNSIAVRIWKGYRKAEVGWIVVEEESGQDKQQTDGNNKHALFLVIYVLKRGILEIWCAQNGPRVTAFNVGKNCKLLYTDHTMFGLNYLILQNIRQSMSHGEFQRYFSHSRCFLFNFESGTIFNFIVPFLCSLTDRNSKKTRDIHILKDIKNLLKKEPPPEQQNRQKFYEDVAKLILILKTAEIRRECLDHLCQSCNDAVFILYCVQRLFDDLMKSNEKQQLDFENKLLAQMCCRIVQLCQYYLNVQKRSGQLREKFKNIITESEQPPDIQQLIEDLEGWTGTDVVRIISLISFRQSILKNKKDNLSENNDQIISISEMLSNFTLYYSHLIKQGPDELYEQLPVEIILITKEEITPLECSKNTKFPSSNANSSPKKLDIKQSRHRLEKLSSFLFWPTFCGDEENLQKLLNEVCIFPTNLLLLLFNAWLNDNEDQNAHLGSSCSFNWPCWPLFSKAFIYLVQIIQQDDDNQKNECDSDPQDDQQSKIKTKSDQKIKLFDFNSMIDDHDLSPSWVDIITLIYESTNINSAFIAINMIKALIHKVKLERTNQRKKKMMQEQQSLMLNESNEEVAIEATDDSNCPLFSADNEWETLHLDKENLNQLAKQLEDLFLLDLLLKSCMSLGENPVGEQRQPGQQRNLVNGIDRISLSFILTSGPGIVSEIVARWAVFHKISPEILACSPHDELNNENEQKFSSPEINIDNEDKIEGKIDAAESAMNELNNQMTTGSGTMLLTSRSTLIEILDHVRRRFPNCLDSDILLINCFWEILLQWNLEPLLISSELPRALKYLEMVHSSVLKHNVSTMAWSVFVQKRFEIICQLIEKMGKKPKDRILRKELDMDENNLEQFSMFCCDLLDFMIRTSASSETEALPLYTVDEWWQSFNSYGSHNYNSLHYNDDGLMSKTKYSTIGDPLLNNQKVPLSVIAMHQKTSNLDLLIEYYHLAQSIQFIVQFSLRNVRPLSLFSSTVRAYFFKDNLCSFLTSNDLKTFSTMDMSTSTHLPSDPVLIEIRMRFLLNIITAIVQTIPVTPSGNNDNGQTDMMKNVPDNDDEEDDDAEGKRTRQQYYITANKWFSKLIQLAKEWNENGANNGNIEQNQTTTIDLDRIRMQYVYDLFLYGCDPLAHELMSTVSDSVGLGRKLLVIAGMRISARLNRKYSSLDEVSFLAPNVLFWLKSLVHDPNCFVDVGRHSICLLLDKISNHLYDDDPINYRICEELRSALKSNSNDF